MNRRGVLLSLLSAPIAAAAFAVAGRPARAEVEIARLARGARLVRVTWHVRRTYEDVSGHLHEFRYKTYGTAEEKDGRLSARLEGWCTDARESIVGVTRHAEGGREQSYAFHGVTLAAGDVLTLDWNYTW